MHFQKRIICTMLLFTAIVSILGAAASAEASATSTRGRYLSEQGIIIPPEEIYTDSYIASINYNYPSVEKDYGLFVYPGNRQMSRYGQPGLLHIGLQAADLAFEELPPLNLALVIDAGSTMNDEHKIDWVVQSFQILVNKIRPQDYLSLVVFQDNATLVFRTTLMDSTDKKQAFMEAVRSIKPQGGSNLEAGLSLGYEQVFGNYRQSYINRVLLMSDGNEFSGRLGTAGGQSGDVRVSLIWDNRNDLDLHVVDPKGEEIYYAHPTASSGGFLDIDMNINGESPKPIENIVWPEGQGLSGSYQVFVNFYGQHESYTGDTNYKVEVKSGLAYHHFEGKIRDYKHQVGTFTFQGSNDIRKEKAIVYQLASSYKDMGISISTIGVGSGFDVDLMRQLAEEGGGSSRFVSDQEEMHKIFDSEFSRMVVPMVKNLDINLEFLADVEILETWGYQHQIEGKHIHYYLPTLHLGDYESILVSYNLLPQAHSQNLDLAEISIHATDSLNQSLPVKTERVQILLNDSEQALDGISDATVMHSNSMRSFAESLKTIGQKYYSAYDDLDLADELRSQNGTEALPGEKERIQTLQLNFINKLESAYHTSREELDLLENVELRLDKPELFVDEKTILNRYLSKLEEEILHNGGSIDPDLIEKQPSSDIPAVLKKIDNLLSELVLSLPENDNIRLALTDFGSKSSEAAPFLDLLNEAAVVKLAGSPGIQVLERSNLDAVLEEQELQLSGIIDTDSAVTVGQILAADYIVTGQVLLMPSQLIVFCRIISIESGQILNAAQIYLDRDSVAGWLN